MRNENTPFTGDYAGQDDIGKPACAHISRRFRGKAIHPLSCARYSEKGRYCHLHDTQAKRNVDN